MTPPPEATTCLLCGEVIAPGDRILPQAHIQADGARIRVVHRECQLRAVLGGIDHLEGRCQHRGHCNELREAAGRTYREDALAVWAWVEQHGVPGAEAG